MKARGRPRNIQKEPSTERSFLRLARVSMFAANSTETCRRRIINHRAVVRSLKSKNPAELLFGRPISIVMTVTTRCFK